MREGRATAAIGVSLRVAMYAVLAAGGMIGFSWLLSSLGGRLLPATLSVFLAAVVANGLAMRIFEQAPLQAAGLMWNSAGVRNMLAGLLGGAGAACIVLAVPLIAGLAELEAMPEGGMRWRTLLFTTAMLLVGAAGEELLFHGYAFQVLVGRLGAFAAVLPFGVLFAAAHSANLGVTRLALANTAAWGILLGYGFCRSGDLWLPIGLHVGWNWVLPLFGVNLSGFRMTVTGYALRWRMEPVWTGGEYGPEGGLLTSLVVVLLAFYLWKAPIRRQTPLLAPNIAGE
jgi:hypothetical protein